MNKSGFYATLISACAMVIASDANASLISGSALNFNAASAGGVTKPATGAWFSYTADVNGEIFTFYVPISSLNGIVIDAQQLVDGSHTGLPGCVNGVDNCTNTGESPSVDTPWGFFQNTGMHGANDADGINVLTDDGAGNVTLDMSGWSMDWNAEVTDLGQGAAGVMTCSGNCEGDDSYTLDYTTIVPSGSFAGVLYTLHLEGSIATVPVPAAAWLLGSGLLALVGGVRVRR